MWRSPNGPTGRIALENGRSLVLKPHFVTDDTALLTQMAIDGSYIAYLPELPYLADPSLKTLFDDLIVDRVCERMAIPDVLADLPRIQELIALTREAAIR
jgi:DNA-binding transcriptional LysR family regulator